MDIKQQLLDFFKTTYNNEPDMAFVSHGRMEISGNHTDHNHGKCMSARCDKAIYCLSKKTDNDYINFYSEGHDKTIIRLDDLGLKEEEIGSSPSLIRGILFYLKEHGYHLCGFDAVSLSDIPTGSGLSSSAAFETLIANIINYYANENKIDKVTIAKAAQFAENVYFNKSCGLLDQISVVFPAVKYIDFENIEKPIVKTIHFPFDLKIALVNTKGSHAGLDGEYSSIPEGMKRVAKSLGVNYLRESSLKALNENKNLLNPNDFKLAYHFFLENERVDKTYEAINKGDVQSFKELVDSSCNSSRDNLKNTMLNEYEDSPLQAIEYARSLNKNITTKLNGGGFKGTVINFIEKDDYDEVIQLLKNRFPGQVIEVSIDNDGKDYYHLDEFFL